MRKKIEEVIVVEGREDERAVKMAVQAQVIRTGGYQIGQETFALMRKAYEGPGLVIFTDPDSAGEAIRRRLGREFPKSKQAFLLKEDALKGGDVGIENASKQSIVKALEAAAVFSKEAGREKQAPFTTEDLVHYGLLGGEGAAGRRSLLGKALGIGYANGKTFLDRLNGFGITREEFYLHGDALFSGNSGQAD